MVRFRYKRPSEDVHRFLYFPYYVETWTVYDPADTGKCDHSQNWTQLWANDVDRNNLHRKNSFYYSLDFEDAEYLQDSPTLAILLFGCIIFCLFIPQIVDLLITCLCPRPPRPPSPPPPPPGPKAKNRLRLYHYARPMRKAQGRKSIVGRDIFYYDPENVKNIVSDTRIKALHALHDSDSSEDI